MANASIDDFITFSEADWLEAIGDSGVQAPGNATFSAEDASATLQAIVTHDQLYSALIYILGYSAVKGNRLHRRRGIRHPAFEWLWAQRATIQGVAFRQKEDARFQGQTLPYASWKRYRITVEFRPVTYEVLDDDEIDSFTFPVQQTVPPFPPPDAPPDPYAGRTGYAEWQRWLSTNTELSTEFQRVQGSTLCFAENPTSPPLRVDATHPLPTLFKEVIPAPFGQKVNKQVLTWTWLQVPVEFITNSQGIYSNLLDAVGCVNMYPFMGYDGGTLLMLPPAIESRAVMIRTTALDSLALQLNIKFRAQQYGPENGNNTSNFRGHNLLPPAGQWYSMYAVRVPYGVAPTDFTPDTRYDKPLYEPYDFRKVFQPPLD